MLASYLSPLAPAVVLLLSAFILVIVIPRLPAAWQIHPGVRYFGAPILVALAGLTLLGVRVAPSGSESDVESQQLSGWNFSTTESVASLSVRLDNIGLPFLVAVVLVLLAVILLRFDPESSIIKKNNLLHVAGWFLLAASACLLFVAASGLTIVYAVMAFDGVAAIYWFGRKNPNLAVARLFLGVLTAGSLMLSSLTTAAGAIDGLFLFGAALWLRLAFYPIVEIMAYKAWRQDERLIYLGVSLLVGIYVMIRTVGQPLPELIRWFSVLTLLLSGVLTWLTGTAAADLSREEVKEARSSVLTWLILTEVLLILLAGPLETHILAVFAVGLVLSLVALWVTPAMGLPRLSDQAWSWPYLPAVTASLTLIGVPFSVGWLAKVSIYQALLSSSSPLITLIAFIGEAFALSGLVWYWLTLVKGDEVNSRWSMIGIVAMVPFLTPGLAPFILSGMVKANLSVTSVEPSPGIVASLVLIVMGGGFLGYFRHQIINYLNIPTELLLKIVGLQWLLKWWDSLFERIGRGILRVRSILEGEHYIGWAIFTALVGALVILLR